MMIFRTLFVLAATTIALPAHAQPLSRREISISASIRDPDGLPVTDVAIGVSNDADINGEPIHVHFDVAGNAAISVQIPVDATYLTLTLGPALYAPLNDPENRNIMSRFRRLKESVSFPLRSRVPLVANETSYSVTLQAQPAINITGRLVASDGTPLPGGIWSRGSWGSASMRSPSDGNFRLTGVAQGEATELICQADGFGVRMVPLSAQQTAANLALGDIIMQHIEPECRIRVQMVPSRGLVTLVNSSTWQIFTFVADTNGAIAILSSGKPGVSVPQGVYFVAPGSLMMNDEPLQLYDLVRSGHAGDHPELTSIIASPTKETAVTADPSEVARKIRAAAAIEQITPNP